jgi:hypothetical protein
LALGPKALIILKPRAEKSIRGSPGPLGESSAVLDIIWGFANVAAGGVLLQACFPAEPPLLWDCAGRAGWRAGDGLVPVYAFLQGPQRAAASLIALFERACSNGTFLRPNLGFLHPYACAFLFSCPF